jgi:hypothetical protein
MGRITTAPAQWRPRTRMSPHVSSAITPTSRAIGVPAWASGSRPSTHERTTPCARRRGATGSDDDSNGVVMDPAPLTPEPHRTLGCRHQSVRSSLSRTPN